MSVETVYLPGDTVDDIEPVFDVPKPADEPVEVEPVAKPPRVRCRDAEPHEVPKDAQELFDLAAPTKPMLLRMTYAQAGDERPQPDLGKCGECGNVVGINADGSMRSHNWPRKPAEKCPGVGADVFAGPDGKAECEGCHQRVKVTKKGVLGGHSVQEPVKKCDTKGGAPETRIPQPTLEPVTSLVLRLAWARDCYAIGCWNDGEFEVGFVWSERPIIEKETGENLGSVSGCTKVGITEYKRYVREQVSRRTDGAGEAHL